MLTTSTLTEYFRYGGVKRYTVRMPDAIYVGRFEPSDPFSLYKVYGSDCKTMAFISTISEEIINMAILGHTPL